MYILRKKTVETSLGKLTIEEFTLLAEDIFNRIPSGKRLHSLFPNINASKFTVEDLKKIWSAIAVVNKPDPPKTTPQDGGIKLSRDEKITFICEKSPGESRDHIIRNWSNRILNYWLEAANSLHEKIQSKRDENKPGKGFKEFNNAVEQARKKHEAVPEGTIEDMVKTFSRKWNKSEQEVREKYTDSELKSAWKNLHIKEVK